MRKVTLRVDAYVNGSRLTVTTDGTAETGKAAKMKAYRSAMSMLREELPDDTARYQVVKIERVKSEAV